MIITDVDKKHPLDDELAGQVDVAGASSSHVLDDLAPPPDGEAPKYTERAFENVYIPPGGEEPPPEFTPYEAEYFISGREVVSHDPHLNEDGEALYRFLLSQSTSPPEYRMHLRGTHTEHRTRFVSGTDSKGNPTTTTEHYTETVTDFDFYIDLTPNIVHGPVHWSLPDAEPAYRGAMVKQVDSNDLVTRDPEMALPSGRRKATKEEIKAAKERKEIRKACGLPPWVAVGPESWFQQQTPERAVVLESSKSLRQWADEYCASDKLLKEFTYTKIVYGWNTVNLREAVIAAIRSVYNHDITVSFDMSHDKIRIRPDNNFSRMLSNVWIKFLLWILLIYPFIWLYKRFNHRGGGRWEVCGGAYALKTWQIQPPGTQIPMYTNDGRWQQTHDGVVHLIGEREGEWFQRWEGTIRDAVGRRVQTSVPLQCGTYVSPQAMILDGFRPALPYVSPPIPR
ncbi:hypothetical protein L227DRAFT_521816 [Lentinus tigrinus ALCF2SS1-6]|uniref:Uncharacterized protein n=1 Tax=Lentinus tigrinus ALCF2SS1-6 TaxID=1328759 RepID=A0A5C2SGL6_9APHY|nr:hypothetical protein L227DRAFT_521816 [Lentinus tigrinus ALCF2SS1-6]